MLKQVQHDRKTLLQPGKVARSAGWGLNKAEIEQLVACILMHENKKIAFLSIICHFFDRKETAAKKLSAQAFRLLNNCNLQPITVNSLLLSRSHPIAKLLYRSNNAVFAVVSDTLFANSTKRRIMEVRQVLDLQS